ncbi:MAG TPA: hypothetical protein VMW27_02730 [Thermoanaerobaculia bacterium]|nr:hypothetical protein [Thermoanaerobaculia bacterium]
MKTDRFSSASTRAAAVLLAASLLLVAAPPADGQLTVRLGRATVSFESPSKRRAKELAQETKAVQQRFDTNRRALRIVSGPDDRPAYARQEVAGLITLTGKDLGQAIERIGELEPLRAWSDETLRRIQQELAATVGHTVPVPRSAAVTASLRWPPQPGFARANAAPQSATITAERTNGLLDQVSEVVGRIFFLAEKDDLEVKLWVGSTPAPQATFRFWSKGKVGGTESTPVIIRTNSKRDHVVRGLYSYRAALTKGQLTQLVQYTTPGSERLDLVNESSFFCCRFNELYCHHVDNEKECRP